MVRKMHKQYYVVDINDKGVSTMGWYGFKTREEAVASAERWMKAEWTNIVDYRIEYR